VEKDFALAHCNLGLALLGKGQFRESVAELRRGHELGSRNPHWKHPSAQWLRQAEHLARLDDRLPDVLAGKDHPKDAAERLGFARVCQLHLQNYAVATCFYSDAFAGEPRLADDLDAQHRYNAACAAALAAAGLGKDAGKLDAKERGILRQKALAWLRADLKAYRQRLEKSADRSGPMIAQRMRQWLQATDLAGVRAPEALARLPEAERAPWQQFWQEVESLRENAAGSPAAASPARP
jgi:hypothetical protein